jgi:hypothetical protein
VIDAQHHAIKQMELLMMLESEREKVKPFFN